MIEICEFWWCYNKLGLMSLQSDKPHRSFNPESESVAWERRPRCSFHGEVCGSNMPERRAIACITFENFESTVEPAGPSTGIPKRFAQTSTRIAVVCTIGWVMCHAQKSL